MGGILEHPSPDQQPDPKPPNPLKSRPFGPGNPKPKTLTPVSPLLGAARPQGLRNFS